MALLPPLQKFVDNINPKSIPPERQQTLQPLKEYIRKKQKANEQILLHCICTHNSRRSHLTQVWAQVMACHFGIERVTCFSGGTEATALFPKVADTLCQNGFDVKILCGEKNPVYSIRYADDQHPVIGFSKTYDDDFNPQSGFCAIMTCSHADENCPLIVGAEARFAIPYDDPKMFDGTPEQSHKYAERSLQIATEFYFIFSKIRA